MWKKLLVAGCLAGVCSVFAVPALQAQKTEAKAEAKAPEKKVTRRLPNFYGDLVDGTQKQKIYDIQDKYTPQIDALAEQIKSLQQKRDSEIESVLNAEQKVKLEKSKADSKAKAAERAAAKKAAEKPAAEVKATAPTAAAVKPPAK
jgi:Spy/CpxP family protein refolding chaperone